MYMSSLIYVETGGICITPRPSSPGAEIIPAMPMRPFFGIEPVLKDPESVSFVIFYGIFRKDKSYKHDVSGMMLLLLWCCY